MSIQLHLTPVDTFFFRNHMSLNAGEESAAMGLFPPRPGTVYGALRSAYVHQHSDFTSFRDGADEDVKRWMGTPSQIRDFRLQGVFLHSGTHLLLPLPLDHEIISEAGEDLAHRLVMKKFHSYETGRDEYLLVGTQSKKTQSPEGGYVLDAETWMTTILSPESVSVQQASRWVTTEPKIGIALHPTARRAQDHMLYEMDMLRLVGDRSHVAAPPSLCVLTAESPDFSDVQVMSMGAEQRPWNLQQRTGELSWLSNEDRAKLVEGIAQTGRARLVLLTPTIWEKTWNHEQRLLTVKDGLQLPILAMAIGRPQLIGGWDMHRNRPKNRSWALTAGSVFYVEVPKQRAAEFVEATYLRNRSDQLEHEGYGLMMPTLVPSNAN